MLCSFYVYANAFNYVLSVCVYVTYAWVFAVKVLDDVRRALHICRMRLDTARVFLVIDWMLGGTGRSLSRIEYQIGSFFFFIQLPRDLETKLRSRPYLNKT